MSPALKLQQDRPSLLSSPFCRSSRGTRGGADGCDSSARERPLAAAAELRADLVRQLRTRCCQMSAVKRSHPYSTAGAQCRAYHSPSRQCCGHDQLPVSAIGSTCRRGNRCLSIHRVSFHSWSRPPVTAHSFGNGPRTGSTGTGYPAAVAAPIARSTVICVLRDSLALSLAGRSLGARPSEGSVTLRDVR